MAQNDTHETSRLAWHSTDVKKRPTALMADPNGCDRCGAPDAGADESNTGEARPIASKEPYEST